ncbi:MAG: AraC family transcriptional regulator [Methylobacter sp.]
MNEKTIPTTHIDLSNVDMKKRYGVWKESVSVIFDSALKPEDRHKPFNATLTAHHLSSMLLSSVTSVQQYFNRDRKLIAKDGLDHFLVQLYTKGSTSGQWSRNNNSTMRSGDIFLLDLNQPIKSLASDFSCLTLAIPKNTIRAKLPNPERYHGRVLPRETGPGKLLGEHLKTLFDASQTLNNKEASAVAEGVLSLVGAYFNNIPVDDNCRHVRNATRESIRHYIINNLTDLNLTTESIAAHFKISRAYLYRLFETGQGIHQFILEQRLLKAYNQLTDPANKLRIGQIAYDLGFNSESHFSRSFHRTFGMTPSDAKQSAQSNERQGKNNSEPDEHLEKWILNLRR